jgi:hypothetical protein
MLFNFSDECTTEPIVYNPTDYHDPFPTPVSPRPLPGPLPPPQAYGNFIDVLLQWVSLHL